MLPLNVLLPDVAERETRSLMVHGQGSGLPSDTYCFAEVYCVDTNCDCRRVILNVVSDKTQEHLATISYSFDRGAPEPGPFLDPLNPQSAHSKALLRLAERFLFPDRAYVARLEQHYEAVKAAVADPDHEIHERLPAHMFEEPSLAEFLAQFAEDEELAPPFVREEPKTGRNDPCPCGSGRKFKRCCQPASA